MSNTRDRLLDVAEELIQTVGYNSFSYRDLAARTAITTASIHYHFPTKCDLGRAVVVRHREGLLARLGEIDAATTDTVGRIRQFAGLFSETLDRDFRMCLCGMLSAEQRTLPADLNREVVQFFAASEGWLARTLRAGVARGEIAVPGSIPRTARVVLATLEGAMLVARVTGQTDRLTEAIASVLASLRLPDVRARAKPLTR